MIDLLKGFCAALIPTKRLCKIVGYVCFLNVFVMALGWFGLAPEAHQESIRSLSMGTVYVLTIFWSIGYKENE
ncbi:hypothetical protein Q4E40_02700 [Pontibacter sp. BT731]|uniref:hypothetical protein n=1 Tax=Pontibacter coccineus TaxID=3063328 RepID=UPI0026E1B4B9|nr:hypothetical protein [Pontibacter sp. BT731]MDO6389022.1 hypothetical protein [Pontibacter sp. BT731]